MPIGIYNGRWRLAARREMYAYQQDRREFIIENNKDKFGDALNELKQADPKWEAWYDDDANIPQCISWLETEEIDELCRRMRARVQEIQNAVSPQVTAEPQ